MATPAVPKMYWEVWFPRNAASAVIVASAGDDELEDAKLTARNYSMFDRIGDRDSVHALGVSLARNYRGLESRIMSAEDTDLVPLRENLVVVGGPGEYDVDSKNWHYGNGLGRLFLERIPSRFSYSSDCETLRANSDEYTARVDRSNRMTRDYGVFRRFPNPFNPRASIIMVHGIHTLGVLGASRVLDGSPESFPNLAVVATMHQQAPEVAFECFFEVEILNGTVAMPTIIPERLFPLPIPVAADVSPSGTPSDGSAAPTTEEVKSTAVALVKVAFDGAIAARRADLKLLLEECSSTTFTVTQAARIVEICRSSPMIPPTTAAEIRMVLRA